MKSKRIHKKQKKEIGKGNKYIKAKKTERKKIKKNNVRKSRLEKLVNEKPSQEKKTIKIKIKRDFCQSLLGYPYSTSNTFLIQKPNPTPI